MNLLNIQSFSLTSDLPFLVLVGLLIALVFSRFLFSKNYELITQISNFQKIKENQASFNGFVDIVFSVLMGLILAKFIAKNEASFQLSLIQYFGITSLLLIVYFFIRFLVLKLIFYFTNNRSNMGNFLNRESFFKFWDIVLLFIACLLLFYSEIPHLYIQFIMIAIWIISLLGETLYYLEVNFKYRIENGYYIFLYLCSLKILPALILLKFGFGWELTDI